VRADRAHFVIGGELFVGAFAPENIEVVKPKVGHDLLQLPLARNGADQFLSLQFAQKVLLRLQVFLPHDGLDLLADRLLILRRVVGRLLLFFCGDQSEFASDIRRRDVVLIKFPDVHLDGRESRQERVRAAVVDALRVKLLVNILVDAEFPNAIDIARARAERDPIQQVNDFLIVGELGCCRPCRERGKCRR